MTAVYPKALAAFLSGAVDCTTDTIRALLVNDSYTYDSGDEFLDDVPSGARIDTPQTLGSKTVTGGLFAAASSTFPDVPAGDTATGVVVYADIGGTDSTRRLLAYMNRRADTLPISIDTDGGDIVIAWPNGQVFKI